MGRVIGGKDNKKTDAKNLIDDIVNLVKITFRVLWITIILENSLLLFMDSVD